MKYSQWIGILVVAVLVFSCFMPWAYYPDLQKSFTGFFSENNIYGKPGKTFIFFAVLCSFCFTVPRVWAKRLNMFICCLLVAYAVKSFILYSGCYRGICPVRQPGLWIMLACSGLVLLASLFPDNKLKNEVS